jgi:hydroxymethylpyrimidine/phosphomethylpyrimidine kinase
LRGRKRVSARMTYIALAVAGSDCSGGAGIQADLKTFAALGVYGASAITALTAQNTTGVTGVHEVPPDFIRRQMDAVFGDLDVKAVKIGMLGTAAAAEAVAEGLDLYAADIPVVLDPVMRDLLMTRASVVTPNIPEAARLLGTIEARDEDQMEEQARALLTLGAKAVLLKGGHAGGAQAVDILVDGSGSARFAAPRFPTRNTHGTGCTLSSAIAAHMARGASLPEAVERAKSYITGAIATADDHRIGKGRGPVHHFHGWWR